MSKNYYDYKGFELPRVTSICDQFDKSGALMGWAVNCMRDYLVEEYTKHPPTSYNEFTDLVNDAKANYRDVSKEALDIGSEVHKAIETYLLTGKEPRNPREEVLSAFLAFLEWESANPGETIKVEHSVYSLSPPYAGTLDWIRMMNGKKYYLDFKSSKASKAFPYKANKMQIAAYRQTDENPESCGSGILRLDKETGYPEFKDLTDKYETDVKKFNLLCEFWWEDHPRLRKKFLDKGGIL